MAAPGLAAFRKIQIGKETTPGTAVAATEIIYGSLATYMDERTIEYPNEDRASLARHMANDYEVARQVPLSFEADVNFRQMVLWLSTTVRGNVTPTQPDPINQPNAYLWTFAHDGTARYDPTQTNGIETFTWEFGESDIQAYEAEYVFGLAIEISGEGQAPNKVALELLGRQLTDTTFTGALSAPTVQRAPFPKNNFYIDTSGANLGNTEKADLLLGYTWRFETTFKPRFTANGQLYFQVAGGEEKKFATFTPKYRWNSDADAERTKFEDRTTTFLRLKMTGATELDSGQSNPPYLIIDGAYRYSEWPTPEEEDGELVVSPTAMTVYDSTWAKQFQLQVLNLLSALP